MRRKKIGLVLGCLALLMLIVASIGPVVVEAKEEAPQYGGVLKVMWGGIRSWDPVGPTMANGCWVYETLLLGDWYTRRADWEFSGEYVPLKFWGGYLAESWEMVDPKTYVFKVRKGVHFHNKPPVNGRELTAEDIKWSFDMFIASPLTAKGELGEVIKEIVVRDKYTLEFRLNEARTDDMIATIGSGPQNGSAFPREVMDKFGKEGFKDWRNAIGTSAWVLDDYVEDSHAVFSRNPNYWQYDKLHPKNRLPYLDGVRLILIRDPATQLAAVRTHKVDITMRSARMQWDQAQSLRKTNPELKYRKILGTCGLVAMHTRKKPFTDVRVRQALNMAIDFDAIARDFYKGNAVNPFKTWPMHMDWKDASIPLEELPQVVQDMAGYNPEKAKKLLAEAGYPKGFKTKVEGMKANVEVLTIIQAYLSQVGVDMQIKTLERGAFSSKKYKHTFDQMLPWTTGTSTPCFQGLIDGPLMYNYRYPALYNYADFEDKWFNAQLAEARSNQDSAARLAKFKELAKYALEQAPYILTPTPYGYPYWTPWVKGSHPDGFYGQVTAKWEWFGPMTNHLWVDAKLKKSITGK